MNKKIIKDALILTAFTLVLGFLLGIVYEVTKEPIAKVNYEKQQNAFKQVFSNADKFEAVEFDKEEALTLMEENGFKDSIDDVQAALDTSGDVLGYVITVTAKDGSQGTITFSVGIQNDGTVNGYSITSISETPGLGMKAKTDEKFYGQFENMNVDSFVVVKQETTKDGEIEAISGSTITSKAMANGCNAAICYFNTKLEGGE
ncbi:MAG: RnfABCDGE type electron transport complex subunit G [Agathobacter sp.]|nr:RnfABCDGE type electron transport complex subunit G [Agathobacter sp.]